MGAVAVPHSMQANQPALQWVNIFTVFPFFRELILRISGRAGLPIFLQFSASSSAMAAASFLAASILLCGVFTRTKPESIRSTPHDRLTAVGRASFNIRKDFLIASMVLSRLFNAA